MRGITTKFITLLVIVIVVTCFSSGVFAAYSYYTCKSTESKNYTEISDGKYDFVKYDYGTSLPFDDAFACAESNGAGQNYIYLSLRFATSGTFFNSFTKWNGTKAYCEYNALGYDTMTGTVKARNSNLNGEQLSITN